MEAAQDHKIVVAFEVPPLQADLRLHTVVWRPGERPGPVLLAFGKVPLRVLQQTIQDFPGHLTCQR